MTHDSNHIQKILPLHFAELEELNRQIMQNHPVGYYWSQDDFSDELKHAQGYLITNSTSQIAAFILYREMDEALEITVLGTRPQFRQQTWMTKLLGYVVEKVAPNAQKALWLEVHENNSAARKLYENWGFKLTSTRPHYYRDGGNACLYSRE